MKNHVYKGRKTRQGVVVTVDDGPLKHRTDLKNHGVVGFNFGGVCSRCKTLALAILAHEVGDKVAVQMYERYVETVVSGLQSGFVLTSDMIKAWIEYHRKQPDAGTSVEKKKLF